MSLGAAYGIAVTGTMAITSVLFYVVARGRRNWSLAHVLPLTGSDLRTRLQPSAVAAVFIGAAPDEQDGADLVAAAYGLTPEEYRAKWSLPADYPMVAPNYAAQRSAFAKKIGLGRGTGRPAGKRVVAKK